MEIDWIAFGLKAITTLQQARPVLDAPAHALSFLGSQTFYLLALPLLYWLGWRELALRMLVLLLAVDAVGASLKIFWHGPRPYWLLPELGLAGEPSYGIPSGHAAGSAVVFGVAALACAEARRRWAPWVLGALIAGVGWSRLHLGVHFPHDVLAGWALGGLGLLVYVRHGTALAAWARGLGPVATLCWASGVAGLALVLGLLVRAASAAELDPSGWMIDNARARAPLSVAADAGAVWGLWLAWRLARVEPDRVPRALCCALGLLGIGSLYLGLGSLFAAWADPVGLPGLALRALRFAAITAWVVAGAPALSALLFQRHKNKGPRPRGGSRGPGR